jgi:hypothetical protein
VGFLRGVIVLARPVKFVTAGVPTVRSGVHLRGATVGITLLSVLAGVSGGWRWCAVRSPDGSVAVVVGGRVSLHHVGIGRWNGDVVISRW